MLQYSFVYRSTTEINCILFVYYWDILFCYEISLRYSFNKILYISRYHWGRIVCMFKDITEMHFCIRKHILIYIILSGYHWCKFFITKDITEIHFYISTPLRLFWIVGYARQILLCLNTTEMCFIFQLFVYLGILL